MDALRWLSENASRKPQEIVKATTATRAWFAVVDGWESFVKWYPTELRETWARTEAAISGRGLHPSIVPLRDWVGCDDGALLVYDRVEGESLDPQENRKRFAALPLDERIVAVAKVSEALAAIAQAGFMVVDWYEGNMIYDFESRQIWLLDWELCREGGGFTLEMDSNYGSSKLMAPEEFVRGSRLDGRTLVFNLGRYALLTLPELAEPLAPVLARATYPARAGRYATPGEYAEALNDGLSTLGDHRLEGGATGKRRGGRRR